MAALYSGNVSNDKLPCLGSKSAGNEDFCEPLYRLNGPRVCWPERLGEHVKGLFGVLLRFRALADDAECRAEVNGRVRCVGVSFTELLVSNRKGLTSELQRLLVLAKLVQRCANTGK